jgi:hypothetical protein
MLTAILALAIAVAPDRVFVIPGTPPVEVSPDPTPKPVTPEQ